MFGVRVMSPHAQLTIEILIASRIQGMSAQEQRDFLVLTILALIEAQS